MSVTVYGLNHSLLPCTLRYSTVREITFAEQMTKNPSNVVVTGIGLLSALGRLPSSWQRLSQGQSAIHWLQPFRDIPPQPLALIGKQPIHLTTLTETIVADALEDAHLTPPLPHCGIVVGSSRGYQAQWETQARQPQVNTGMLDFLPHMAAIQAARQVGSIGSVLAPMAACATGLWAVAQGYELIQTGQCQQVIAGAVEAPITPLTIAGFNRMKALAKTGAYPFDRNREGFVLAEGGAVLVLESAEWAQNRGAEIYGKILGFGLTADAWAQNRPDLQGNSAIAAIQHALHRSHLSPDQIDCIHAHGTATKLNDQHEAHLIQTLFPSGVAVSASKGATGHTLGASAALGVAFSLMALKHQQLTPCVGLTEPEFDLDFVNTTRQTAVQQILCLSFGFGGLNGAIILGQGN